LKDPLDKVSSVVLFVLVMLSLSVFLSVKYVDNRIINGPSGFVVHHYKIISNNNAPENDFKVVHYNPEYPEEKTLKNRATGMATGMAAKEKSTWWGNKESILSRIKNSPNRTTIMMLLYVFWIVIVGVFQMYGHEQEIKKRRKNK